MGCFDTFAIVCGERECSSPVGPPALMRVVIRSSPGHHSIQSGSQTSNILARINKRCARGRARLAAGNRAPRHQVFERRQTGLTTVHERTDRPF
jgi:hypothetical protein